MAYVEDREHRRPVGPRRWVDRKGEESLIHALRDHLDALRATIDGLEQPRRRRRRHADDGRRLTKAGGDEPLDQSVRSPASTIQADPVVESDDRPARVQAVQQVRVPVIDHVADIALGRGGQALVANVLRPVARRSGVEGDPRWQKARGRLVRRHQAAKVFEQPVGVERHALPVRIGECPKKCDSHGAVSSTLGTTAGRVLTRPADADSRATMPTKAQKNTEAGGESNPPTMNAKAIFVRQ